VVRRRKRRKLEDIEAHGCRRRSIE